MYLITNANDYLAFAGSMNLTNAAVNHNLEQLDCDYGKQMDRLYQCHIQMFMDNYQRAATYLDAKKITGFIKAKNEEQLQINVYTDAAEMIKSRDSKDKNVIFLSPEDVKKFKDTYSSDQELAKLSAREKFSVAQTVKLFGDTGYKKRNLDHIGENLYSLTQVIKRVSRGHSDNNNQVTHEEELYPKPVLFYNHGQLFESPRVSADIKSRPIESTLQGDNLRKESDIAHEYDNYKDPGEGWQACDFMCFLFEAPWLWKIRNIYEMSTTSKSREDVPLGVALIGKGRTGKSTLGQVLAAKLTGSGNFLDNAAFEAQNYALAKANTNMTITNVLTIVKAPLVH